MPDAVGRLDPVGFIRLEPQVLADQSKASSSRPVVEIAVAAKLGIVGIAGTPKPVVEQVLVGVPPTLHTDSRLVRGRYAWLFRPRCRPVRRRQTCDSGRIVFNHLLNLGEQGRGIVAVVVEVVNAQKLPRSRASPRPPARSTGTAHQGAAGNRPQFRHLERRSPKAAARRRQCSQEMANRRLPLGDPKAKRRHGSLPGSL